jgi:hypothetical protein
MGWKIGFVAGGLGGAVLGSAGAYMVNNKKVEKGGEVKWEARIPQPLYAVRTGINAVGIIGGALLGAMTGGFVQSNFTPFSSMIGQHNKNLDYAFKQRIR